MLCGVRLVRRNRKVNQEGWLREDGCGWGGSLLFLTQYDVIRLIRVV